MGSSGVRTDSLGRCFIVLGVLGAGPSPTGLCLSICLHTQPPAGFAVAAALSTSCPPPAAAYAVRSVTTTGGGCGGIEVRLQLQ